MIKAKYFQGHKDALKFIYKKAANIAKRNKKRRKIHESQTDLLLCNCKRWKSYWAIPNTILPLYHAFKFTLFAFLKKNPHHYYLMVKFAMLVWQIYTTQSFCNRKTLKSQGSSRIFGRLFLLGAEFGVPKWAATHWTILLTFVFLPPDEEWCISWFEHMSWFSVATTLLYSILLTLNHWTIEPCHWTIDAVYSLTAFPNTITPP